MRQRITTQGSRRWLAKSRGLVLAASFVGTVALLAGCSSTDGERAPGALRVVTTTAILGEFAREVAGPDAEVSSLIPPGADPHSFEAPTQAARAVAAADVIIVNGYGLEGALLSVVAENRRTSAVVVVAAGGIEALAAAEGDHDAPSSAGGLPSLAYEPGDPHLWLDPDLAARYVEHITSALVAADPPHAEGYRGRGAMTAVRYRALRAELAGLLVTIPPERRRIVVFHDAFAYFARAFDFRLAAGVLPEHGGREPSAGELADTVALVRAQGVPAVYREPQFSAGVLDAVARETGVRVLVLYSDAYGPGVEGYEEMMRANARALLAGLAPAAAR
jgi:manganese/iron transport system substrate-binding protein